MVFSKMADSEQSKRDVLRPPTLNAPVIMKVDEVKEDQIEEENENNEKNKNSEDFKICSPSNRIMTTTSNNPFSISHQNKSSGILKPPQLNFNKTTKPFVLNPSRLNPFNKSQETNSNGDSSSSSQQNGEVPKFVPLVQSDPKPAPQSTTAAPVANSATKSASTASGFIFGQNLQDRVKAAANQSSSTTKKDDEPTPSTSLNTNGTSEMLFSSAVKDTNSNTNCNKKETTKSLSESAREYEESRANKRKYEEVEIITGEEEETNILSTTCKLFAFDKTSGSWQERGRGNLRLNDLEVDENHTQSRLVFRTTGSLRVILNTKIWAEMTIEQASERSIRLTALDANGEIKVFLIMANIEDTKNLFSQLQYRLQKEISAQKHKKHNPTADSGANN